MEPVFVERHPLPGPPQKGEGDIEYVAQSHPSTGITLPLVGRVGRG
jgi:hypothetical protein